MKLITNLIVMDAIQADYFSPNVIFYLNSFDVISLGFVINYQKKEALGQISNNEYIHQMGEEFKIISSKEVLEIYAGWKKKLKKLNTFL